MKILHLVPSYWPAFPRGGPIWSVHNLNKLLVKNGFDVTVYTTNIDIKNGDVQLNQENNVDGVKVYYFPLTWQPWQYSSALHKKLKETIKDFDLVHITSTFLSVSTLGAYYAKKFNVPYIISPRGNLMKGALEHNSFKKNLYMFLIEKGNLSGADAIHFTTDLEKNEYIATRLPLKKAILISNHLSIENSDKAKSNQNFRQKYNISKDSKVILFLGRINWKKGFDTLIPAFAEVLKKEPKAKLVIAGRRNDEDYRFSIEKMIKKEGIGHSVIFTDMILGADKNSALEESDVFVLPSYSENFAMAVLEAMAMGLPVVITEGVGIASWVEKAQAGIVIKKDKDELANSILKILKDPISAKKMGEAGKKLVQEEFSEEKVAEKWIRAYNDLIHAAVNKRGNTHI